MSNESIDIKDINTTTELSQEEMDEVKGGAGKIGGDLKTGITGDAKTGGTGGGSKTGGTGGGSKTGGTGGGSKTGITTGS